MIRGRLQSRGTLGYPALIGVAIFESATTGLGVSLLLANLSRDDGLMSPQLHAQRLFSSLEKTQPVSSTAPNAPIWRKMMARTSTSNNAFASAKPMYAASLAFCTSRSNLPITIIDPAPM